MRWVEVLGEEAPGREVRPYLKMNIDFPVSGPFGTSMFRFEAAARRRRGAPPKANRRLSAVGGRNAPGVVRVPASPGAQRRREEKLRMLDRRR